MTVKRTNIDSLNALLTIEINKIDYAEKVEKVLKNYSKNAVIPGFRKGAVPINLVRKQYGKAILLEEVNKLIQETLNNYIQTEKLSLLGNPLPRPTENLDLDAEQLIFDFEIGLSPDFQVNLAAKNKITRYKVVADKDMLDKQVLRIRKQYGKVISQEEITAESDIKGSFISEQHNINNQTTLTLDVFAKKATSNKFLGKKIGDRITVQTKGLFDDDHQLMDYLKIPHDEVHGLAIDVDFVIESISMSEPAELTQELFDRLFGPGNLTSEAALKDRIKEDAEKQFNQQADQKFLNDVNDWLLSVVDFDLPADFLKRWLQTAGEKTLSSEEAAAEYAKSEKGLRYQLIEGKIMEEHNLQVTFDDIKQYTAAMIKKQMAQFGQLNPSEEDIEPIVARVLSNQDEIRRLSDQLMSEKMLQLYKDKITAKEKEVSYDQFVKELYGE